MIRLSFIPPGLRTALLSLMAITSATMPVLAADDESEIHKQIAQLVEAGQYKEAVATAHQLESVYYTSFSIAGIARAQHWRKDADGAARTFDQAIATATASEDPVERAVLMAGLAWLWEHWIVGNRATFTVSARTTAMIEDAALVLAPLDFDFDEDRREWGDALAIIGESFETGGLPQVSSLLCATLIQILASDVDGAAVTLKQMLAVPAGAGFDPATSWSLSFASAHLARAQFEAGQVAKAAASADISYERVTRVPAGESDNNLVRRVELLMELVQYETSAGADERRARAIVEAERIVAQILDEDTRNSWNEYVELQR